MGVRRMVAAGAVVVGVGVVGYLPVARSETSAPPPPRVAARVDAEWPAYGGTDAGRRYSTASGIGPENVATLEVAWTYRTGELDQDGPRLAECPSCDLSQYKFEATPLMVDGRLYLSTPLNRVLALDATNGRELWRFDPRIETGMQRSEGFVSRGVAYRSDPNGPCGDQIFFGTVDARLLALHAGTGRPCDAFGADGTVRLDEAVGRVSEGQYGVTSPPLVVDDLVVVGSSIGDNRRVDLERGIVRAYRADTGALVWSWDPIARDPSDRHWSSWGVETVNRTGGANAWAPMSADHERGLVFVPTGSAAPDFYGGERIGSNLYANSVVALAVETGRPVWHYQVVHHDLWDYDVPAQPTLTSIVDAAGVERDVVVVGTKMGFIFVLDRETGEPVLPVEERPVPASDVPGESAWPTQPIPVAPRPLHPLRFTEDDLWGLTPDDEAACRAAIRPLRYDGPFTPPSLQGTLMFPGNAGGINWGGLATDPERDVFVVNHNRLPYWVRLVERSHPDRGNQRGTPYTMERDMIRAPSGLPCVQPPWGVLSAVRVSTGEVLWEVPWGRMPGLEQVPGSEEWGALGLGGPIATASGLVFIAGTMDDKIRAYDVSDGRVLWESTLPAGGQATPMTYEVEGHQYLVIAAGGHGGAGTTPGDFVVAYALPR